MKLVFISDTHGKHNEVNIPEGDLLIHAGDVSSKGTESEIKDFLSWFSKQPHEYKIFIPGNHDFYFEKNTLKIIEPILPKNIIYLNDSGCVIKGINIWGSPIQPEFFNWAFNRKRGSEIKKHWDLIPETTDILITHGPPFGILDQTIQSEKVGCRELLKKVIEVKPKIHAFGHIHEDYGIYKKNETSFINASVLNQKYQYANSPITIDY